MINETTEKLDVREEVKNVRIKHQPIELKAGDKVFIREDLEDGKKNRYGYRFFKRTMKTGENVVKSVIDDLIKIEEDIHNRYTSDMIDWEQTAILNATKAPSFDDLIDVAVNAVRNEIIQSFNFSKSLMERDLIFLIKHDGERVGFGYDQAQDGINYLELLATETFVIDDVSDVLNCKGEARFVFSNGVEGEFLEAYDDGAIAAILLL